MKLTEILNCIQNKGYFIGTYDVISEANNLDIESTEGLKKFKKLLNDVDLDCLPKIVNGCVANIEKSLTAISLVIFTKNTPLKRSDSNIKYGLLVGKIAAVMAKVDGAVDQEEIMQIRKSIYQLSFLSESEKYLIFIRSVYALQQKSTKEELINQFSSLPAKAKKQALDIVKEIAISDHYVDRTERLFLAEFYRLSDIPTATIARDLRALAKRKNIILEQKTLSSHCSEEFAVEDVLEIDSSFDEMLNEFENF